LVTPKLDIRTKQVQTTAHDAPIKSKYVKIINAYQTLIAD